MNSRAVAAKKKNCIVPYLSSGRSDSIFSQIGRYLSRAFGTPSSYSILFLFGYRTCPTFGGSPTLMSSETRSKDRG
jgi:hypothetical protein